MDLTIGTAVAVLVICSLAWLANLVTLPGNWLMVAILAGYAWYSDSGQTVEIGWRVVATAFVLALMGEAVEFLAGAAGAKRAGASRRSTLYAIGGSMIGAILGAVVGVPIPIIGSLIAAVLFGGVGATAGAMYGEWTDGRDWQESWAIGKAAFWGRTLGVAGKMLFGLGILVVAVAGVLL